ncbi:MAG TPA: RagB/SusD family nutrient uptake outer membrane protein [Gemmatimonadales bacterium]|nr:RagB/SusD family nutrient uptake outer membrane protein [Gemmatimonadales bacterium]
MKTLLRSRLVLGTAFVALLGGITYACSNFLDTPAQGTLDESALQTKTGVEGSLIAAYRMLDCNAFVGAWGCAASNWVFGDITSDDAYKGSEASDQPGATQVELYTWNTGQAGDYFDQKWATSYEGVVRANATLRLLRGVMASKPGEISAVDSAGIEGEALFLRAHYHFEAWRMWGKIPYYYEDDTDYKKENNMSPDSVAKLIIADLDRAIAALPPLIPRNGEVGRATQWTAKAYKARVLVYTGQYAAALVVLNDVINNGPYGLETSFDHVWTGFQALKNGPETIFAYEASANDGEPSGWNANWGETLNFPHSGSPFGCCGFHQPSQNLVNVYAVDGATGLPKAFTDPAGWNARDSTWVASVSDTVDPRLDWTVGRDFVPYKDWGLHQGDWIRTPAYGGRYSPKKNAQENASGSQSQVGWNKAQLNSVHIHLFRYADLLLMKAEAEVEAGSIPIAQGIVNQIRARAGQTAQGCGGAYNATTQAALEAAYPLCVGDTRLAVPIADSSIQWATYKVSAYTVPWPDQATARLAVRTERRLELGMEGQRFFDLRRWGEAYATTDINNYLTREKTRRGYKVAQLPFASKNMFYPIPPTEIDLSKVGGQDRLHQNPGW